MGTYERRLRIVVVFALINFTRIFFRSPTFSVATDMLHSIFRATEMGAEKEFAMLGIPAASFAYIYASKYRERWLNASFEGWTIPGYALYLTLLLALGATRAEFIYFQF